MFSNIYNNRRVLVTGHSGFKGSWLVLWLKMLNAKISAVSLPPETSPNHWESLDLDIESHYIDIRDSKQLRAKIKEIRPEILFHLAAQPLVRRSYVEPLDTWSTNVMGTANLLDACRYINELIAIVVVTTDKCYENKEWVWGYREIDNLGGHDPYSASKAGCELVASSYRQSYFNSRDGALLATARAGNVIGGGDWSADRLIPDLVRSVMSANPLEIRSPNATRPWQHVLECLAGYLMLGQKLLEGDRTFADAWNFGPDIESNRFVKQVLTAFEAEWPEVKWYYGSPDQRHEAQLLHLDSSKARQKLQWHQVWTFEEGIKSTARWYKEWLATGSVVSLTQLQNYIKLGKERGLPWVGGSN